MGKISHHLQKKQSTPTKKKRERPKPNAGALKALERLAKENRTPPSWWDKTDDPTVPESKS